MSSIGIVEQFVKRKKNKTLTLREKRVMTCPMPGRSRKQRTLRRGAWAGKACEIPTVQALTPEQIAGADNIAEAADNLSGPQANANMSGEADSKSVSRFSPAEYDLLREQILRLHASGLPIAGIVRRLGASPELTKATVSKHLAKEEETGGITPAALLSGQFHLAATAYTAIQQEQIRRFTVLQAARDRVLGPGAPTAEQLRDQVVRELEQAMDQAGASFTRTTKEYVETIQRMGVPGAAGEREKGSYPPTSTPDYYTNIVLSDRDLGELKGMLRRQMDLVGKMEKKQKVLSSEGSGEVK